MPDLLLPNRLLPCNAASEGTTSCAAPGNTPGTNVEFCEYTVPAFSAFGMGA